MNDESGRKKAWRLIATRWLKTWRNWVRWQSGLGNAQTQWDFWPNGYIKFQQFVPFCTEFSVFFCLSKMFLEFRIFAQISAQNTSGNNNQIKIHLEKQNSTPNCNKCSTEFIHCQNLTGCLILISMLNKWKIKTQFKWLWLTIDTWNCFEWKFSFFMVNTN